MAGSIWNLGYFPNLVLIAAFIGIGAGFLFHRRFSEALSARIFVGSAAWLLCLCAAVAFFHPGMPGFDQGQGNFDGDLYFTASLGPRTETGLAWFPVWLLSCVGIFACVSQKTAKVFRLLKPLEAYTFDILGSCAGIILFMLASWRCLPAWSWFLGLAPLFYLGAHGQSAQWRLAAAALLLACAALAKRQDSRALVTRWSPYQKVEYFDNQTILVNGIPHQSLRDLEGLSREPAPYARPFEVRRQEKGALYRRVLVLGAGAGNDVAAGLLNGAQRVDAVEIDPVIADLGRRYHPLKPYDDPRVRVVIGDGRAFLRHTRGTYDLIVFALTDSLVKVSPMAQLRLENYLFTLESIACAYSRLAEGGSLFFYNYYRQPWLADKIEKTAALATHQAPRLLYQSDDFVMFSVTKGSLAAADAGRGDLEATTDDWPFLYLEHRGVPPVYAWAIAALLTLVGALLWVLRRRTEAERIPSPILVGFLLMGLAFSLLETMSIIQFSLLFGTTWLTSSLVFLAVLLLVLLANLCAPRARAVPPAAWFAALVASCLAPWVYPLARLLSIENLWLRYGAASLMTLLPVFFAGLIFSTSFQDRPEAEYIFGWNLVGAMAGGLVEYASLALGYRALSLIVAFCYVLTYISLNMLSYASWPRRS